MTDELRTAFDDMLVGEPPLRTSADDTVARGRRLRRRQRAVWTSLGTALAVAAVALVPQVINHTAGPTSPAARQTSAGASPTRRGVGEYLTDSGPLRTSSR